MTIGAQTNTNSRSRVSPDHQIVRSSVSDWGTAEDIITVGKYRQRRWPLQLRFSTSPTVRPVASAQPVRRANSVRIGGILAFFAP